MGGVMKEAAFSGVGSCFLFVPLLQSSQPNPNPSPPLTVAVDGTLRVDWSVASSLSDVALLGSTRTGLARRLFLTAPSDVLDFSEVPNIPTHV